MYENDFKLIAGELIPTDGMIKRHSHLKIARYHQHLAEKLDMTLSPLEYMMKEYPEVKEIEDMRKIVGRYGITGKNQVVPISSLSDGLRVSNHFNQDFNSRKFHARFARKLSSKGFKA